MPPFISGLELSRRFYQESVRPTLDASFPGLAHSAALLGRGSEVLGFDDEMSTDHNSEARVLFFLRDDDQARQGDAIAEALREQLPARFHDRPTDHAILTLRGYVLEQLGFDIDGELEARRLVHLPGAATSACSPPARSITTTLACKPSATASPTTRDDVWLYLLAAGWWRVHPEANLVGRAGFVGDELGSALIGSRLVDDLMRLCFLMERQYAPYSKWFGTAFSRLACAPELSPLLWNASERADLAGARGGAAGCLRAGGGHAQRAAGRLRLSPPRSSRCGTDPSRSSGATSRARCTPRSRTRRCCGSPRPGPPAASTGCGTSWGGRRPAVCCAA